LWVAFLASAALIAQSKTTVDDWRFKCYTVTRRCTTPGFSVCQSSDGLKFVFKTGPGEILSGFKTGKFQIAWELLSSDVEATGSQQPLDRSAAGQRRRISGVSD